LERRLLDRSIVSVARQRTVRLPVGVGSVLGDKYVIEHVIATGAMGVVARGRNVDLGTRVAIKVVHPWLLERHDLVARFFREARELARLRSEHVVRVHDVSSPRDPWPYMVMDLLEGHDLESILSERGRLSVHTAVDLALQTCAGLRVAHAAGVVHRDIKPANLFFAREADGRSILKIVDFGILYSRSACVKLTKRHQFLGSPMYMAPEQIAGEEVDDRADIFSLGASLYEMLTGIAPFDGSTLHRVIQNVTTRVPPAPSESLDTIPTTLSDVVMRCLEKDRARRFAHVDELAAALEPFSSRSNRMIVAKVPGLRPPAAPHLRAQRAIAFALGFLVSAAAIFALARGGFVR
jgi:serine/threonine-protein kinase